MPGGAQRHVGSVDDAQVRQQPLAVGSCGGRSAWASARRDARRPADGGRALARESVLHHRVQVAPFVDDEQLGPLLERGGDEPVPPRPQVRGGRRHDHVRPVATPRWTRRAGRRARAGPRRATGGNGRSNGAGPCPRRAGRTPRRPRCEASTDAAGGPLAGSVRSGSGSSASGSCASGSTGSDSGSCAPARAAPDSGSGDPASGDSSSDPTAAVGWSSTAGSSATLRHRRRGRRLERDLWLGWVVPAGRARHRLVRRAVRGLTERTERAGAGGLGARAG